MATKPTITTETLPNMIRNRPYSTFVESDGTPKITYSIIRGHLPEDLYLVSHTGEIRNGKMPEIQEELEPEVLTPKTTPLLEVNDDFVCYLPFDDYPDLDLAGKIHWENHGCELIEVGEGAHNKRLSFANGGYMIGTGNFSLLDVDNGMITQTYQPDPYNTITIHNLKDTFDLTCTPYRDTSVELDVTTEWQGAYICLYNDDCSNFIAFVNGRRDSDAEYIPLTYSRTEWSNANNVHTVYPLFRFEGPEAGGPRRFSSYATELNKVPYQFLPSLSPSTRDGTKAICLKYHSSGPESVGDGFSLYKGMYKGNLGQGFSLMYDINPDTEIGTEVDAIENGYSVGDTSGYQRISFTHISINYNPLYPEARFSGWMGPIVLRKGHR